MRLARPSVLVLLAALLHAAAAQYVYPQYYQRPLVSLFILLPYLEVFHQNFSLDKPFEQNGNEIPPKLPRKLDLSSYSPRSTA